MERVRLVISGKVQGVNFRFFAKQNADKRGIVGYARNLSNGAVEIVAQGQPDKLKDFVRECNRGPLLARISEVKQSSEPVSDEFDVFEVRP